MNPTGKNAFKTISCFFFFFFQIKVSVFVSPSLDLSAFSLNVNVSHFVFPPNLSISISFSISPLSVFLMIAGSVALRRTGSGGADWFCPPALACEG